MKSSSHQPGGNATYPGTVPPCWYCELVIAQSIKTTILPESLKDAVVNPPWYHNR